MRELIPASWLSSTSRIPTSRDTDIRDPRICHCEYLQQQDAAIPALPHHPSPITHHQQRGFALLLTLVVVGVIGTVAFGVGYLTLHSYSATVRFQDSQSALQAAEAGIEDGLLRFRFDRNAQVPTATMCAGLPTFPTGSTVDKEPTDSTKFVLRVNLTTGVLQCVDPTSSGTPAPDPTQNVYDLKISYKSASLGGNFSNPADPSNPPLKKDETLQIAGIPADSTQLTLKYVRSSTTPAIPSSPFYRGEIQVFDENNDLISTIPITRTNEGDFSLQAGFSIQTNIAGKRVNRLTYKSLDPDVSITARLDSGNKPIDYGFTDIVSTGYSNGVKRKLSSKMNRASGNVTGIYNFVLFGGASSVLGQ